MGIFFSHIEVSETEKERENFYSLSHYADKQDFHVGINNCTATTKTAKIIGIYIHRLDCAPHNTKYNFLTHSL